VAEWTGEGLTKATWAVNFEGAERKIQKQFADTHTQRNTHAQQIC